ncbi:hypothetical protein BG004_000090 [Podila humilis]|nr:hypothetical protein BG004_000090 [Podila humilis]
MPSTTSVSGNLTMSVKAEHGPVSAEELFNKLAAIEKKPEQRPKHSKCLIQIDPELKQRAQDTFQDILAGLERHHQEHEPISLEDTTRHLHPTAHKTLHKRISSSTTMRQSHGNANLRHGADVG